MKEMLVFFQEKRTGTMETALTYHRVLAQFEGSFILQKLQQKI